MNSRSLYLLCLRAYPAAFRQRHGAEMLRIFEAEWRAARHAGWLATLACAVHVLSDLARTAPHERFGATTHTGWLAFGTATFCGVTTTWVQFVGGHTQLSATAVVLFTGTVFFSYFAGVRTWRWPVTVAAWLPSVYLFAYLADVEFAERLGSKAVLLSLFLFGWALTISFAGTGVGVLLRRAFPIRFGCGKSNLPEAHEKL